MASDSCWYNIYTVRTKYITKVSIEFFITAKAKSEEMYFSAQIIFFQYSSDYLKKLGFKKQSHNTTSGE